VKREKKEKEIKKKKGPLTVKELSKLKKVKGGFLAANRHSNEYSNCKGESESD